MCEKFQTEISNTVFKKSEGLLPWNLNIGLVISKNLYNTILTEIIYINDGNLYDQMNFGNWWNWIFTSFH